MLSVGFSTGIRWNRRHGSRGHPTKNDCPPHPKLEPYFADLTEIALDWLPYEQWWSSAIADGYAQHHRHDLAADLAFRVAEQYPDTNEQRPMRSWALQIAWGHRANATIAKGEYDDQSQTMSEWAALLKDGRKRVRAGWTMEHLQIDLKEQFRVRRDVSDGLESLASGSRSTPNFEELSQRLVGIDQAPILGDDRWAVSEALRSLQMAANWPLAVEAADAGADAFREASRLIATKALLTDRHGVWSDGVVRALEILEHLGSPSEVPMAATALRRAPLLFPTTDLLAPRPKSPDVNLHRSRLSLLRCTSTSPSRRSGLLADGAAGRGVVQIRSIRQGHRLDGQDRDD